MPHSLLQLTDLSQQSFSLLHQTLFKSVQGEKSMDDLFLCKRGLSDGLTEQVMTVNYILKAQLAGIHMVSMHPYEEKSR